MKRSFRDEWTHELRTTTTPQTTGLLERLQPQMTNSFGGNIRHVPAIKKPAGMCCIGVRCNLDYRKGLMIRESNIESAGYAERMIAGQIVDPRHSTWDYGNVVNRTLVRWGIPTNTPDGDPYGENRTLIGYLVHLNDHKKASFIEIADFLDSLPVTDETGTFIDRLKVS